MGFWLLFPHHLLNGDKSLEAARSLELLGNSTLLLPRALRTLVPPAHTFVVHLRSPPVIFAHLFLFLLYPSSFPLGPPALYQLCL